MNIILLISCIIIIPAVIIIISVAPGEIPPEAKSSAELFCGLNCAHRGLYTEDQGIPENSIPAFAAAKEKGYGIELDVHLTADGQVAVFHDYDLKRACGADKQIRSMSYDELRNYRLFGTDEIIPLLRDVLEILDGTPVIIEIKPAGSRNAQLCRKTLEIIRQYGKKCCIESFDPRVCRWFKRNAPDILRGQLGCPPSEYIGISKLSSLILGNLLLNSLARPHFISYKNVPYTLIARICLKMKPMRAIWTINPNHDIPKVESENDIIIFEHYMPEPKFKVSG